MELPDTAFATKPNELWAWDISHLLTYTPGQFFYLYALLDWVSRKVVAWHLSESLASSEVPKLWDKAIEAEGLLRVPRCLWPTSMSHRGTQDEEPFYQEVLCPTCYRTAFRPGEEAEGQRSD